MKLLYFFIVFLVYLSFIKILSVIFIKYPKCGAGFLYLLISQILCMVSLPLIEWGGYISETDTVGHINGSSILYSAFVLIFYTGFCLSYQFINKNYEYNKYEFSNRESKIIILLIIFIIAFLYAHAIAYGKQIPRFDKLKNAYPDSIIFTMTTIFGAIGYYGLLNSNKKSVIILVLIIIGSLLSGGEAGSVFGAYVTYLSARLLKGDELHKVINLSKILLISLICISLKIIIDMIYRDSSIEEFSYSLNIIIERFINQAHLFWFSVEYYFDKNFDLGFINFFNNFFNSFVRTKDFGLGRFMSYAAPNIADDFLDKGIIISGGFPGIFLLGLDIFSTSIICLLFGALYCFIFFLSYRIAVNYSFLLFIFAFYFLSQMQTLISSGDFGFINIKFFTYLFIFITLYLSRDIFFRNCFLFNFKNIFSSRK